jgi:hypothetical protein
VGRQNVSRLISLVFDPYKITCTRDYYRSPYKYDFAENNAVLAHYRSMSQKFEEERQFRAVRPSSEPLRETVRSIPAEPYPPPGIESEHFGKYP